MARIYATLALLLIVASGFAAEDLTDDEIRKLLIQRSIAAYSGNCPCPYSVMRNGRRCGGNSAYSKPGGASPLCYPTDVTAAMIDRYRKLAK